MSGIDPADAARSIEGLRQADLASGELEASLRAVATATAELFGADGGGIMLVDDQQSLHYVGATDGRAAALEAAQEETGEGPCVDSLIGDVVVETSDLLSDPRWPRLRAEVGQLGVHAIVGVPLHVGLTAIGSLNVYRYRVWEWSGGDVDALRLHATMIEELLAAAMLAGRRHTIVDQLTTALENRVVIDRATGIVMAIAGLDAAQAFNALRLEARSRRVRVADYAHVVVAQRQFPIDPGQP